MGNTQFNHAVLARVAKSLMRSCGVRTRITCVFHRVNFKWAQCASPQPAPSHLEFALTLPMMPPSFWSVGHKKAGTTVRVTCVLIVYVALPTAPLPMGNV